MTQTRLPRQVYDAGREAERPCLLTRARVQFRLRTHRKAVLGCTFRTLERSVGLRLELFLPPVLRFATRQLPNGRKKNRWFVGTRSQTDRDPVRSGERERRESYPGCFAQA